MSVGIPYRTRQTASLFKLRQIDSLITYEKCTSMYLFGGVSGGLQAGSFGGAQGSSSVFLRCWSADCWL